MKNQLFGLIYLIDPYNLGFSGFQYYLVSNNQKIRFSKFIIRLRSGNYKLPITI